MTKTARNKKYYKGLIKFLGLSVWCIVAMCVTSQKCS